jgi:hypothetical protein
MNGICRAVGLHFCCGQRRPQVLLQRWPDVMLNLEARTYYCSSKEFSQYILESNHRYVTNENFKLFCTRATTLENLGAVKMECWFCTSLSERKRGREKCASQSLPKWNRGWVNLESSRLIEAIVEIDAGIKWQFEWCSSKLNCMWSARVSRPNI